MTQQVRLEPGAIRSVGDILDHLAPQSIFLATGKASFALCGAEAALGPPLKPRRVTRFAVVEPNPRLGTVEEGLALFRKEGCGRILAVGGGTVLDTAKLIGFLAAQEASPVEIVRGGEEATKPSHPLIAVPTTAGSGSEATHFAVVYVENEKFSVAHASMLPEYAVVDPELTKSLLPQLTAVTGLDALCQAVESLWSVSATEESLGYAREAIPLALENLPTAVYHPSGAVRHAMCRASHLAGRAINLTRTTAPHALSYTMTARFGVPHGHAVALTLGPMLVYNSLVTEEDARDPRGAAWVRRRIAELNDLFGCPDAVATSKRLTELIESLGLPSRLGEVGIRTPAHRKLLVEHINVERLANNPRRLTGAALEELLDKLA